MRCDGGRGGAGDKPASAGGDRASDAAPARAAAAGACAAARDRQGVGGAELLVRAEEVRVDDPAAPAGELWGTALGAADPAPRPAPLVSVWVARAGGDADEGALGVQLHWPVDVVLRPAFLGRIARWCAPPDG
eukprot:gene25201-39919_t